MKQQIYAACPHACPDACGVQITVEDGRATKIQGDARHPVTRGFLCAKVTKYLDRVYSPGRLLYPMRRKKNVAKGAGAKSAEDFERISWDAALDEIYERLSSISREFGPEAILPYSYGGTLGVLNNASMDHRFFHRLGASQLDRTICATAGGEALISVVGRKLGSEPEAFRRSKYIIAWGANIHGNNIHLWPFIEEARRNGAKLIVIDPYRTRTAACADWYLPINPGTDVALALALMHVIINEHLYDADYVSKYTHGFEALRERVQEYPPEKVAQWTGISASDIRKLAHEYVSQGPAAIRVNYGVQRSENGGSAMRAIAMLPCITGSWKELGGGLQLSTSGGWQLNNAALTRPDLMMKSPLGREARVVNMSELGQALTTLDDPPVKAVFVYNSNPAAVAPNHNDVIRGFKRADLFTVVHEQFFTDTTDYADIVLPATTFFEHKELQTSYEHYSESLAATGLDPVVQFVPPSESRHSQQAREYPLELLARKADNFLNSTFCNLPVTQAMESPGRLEISAADAAARNIKDGDPVRVFNSRGAVKLQAQVNGATQTGVVAARLNWAKLSPEGASINVLTSEKLTDIGRGATFYSTLVEVERV